jgi:CelD/BcsL family acetyltransferase involved in cellulose biosynthesis
MVGTLTSVGDALARNAPPSTSSVDVVTEVSAFVALEREWNDAVERARIPHPFLRHEWLRTWWECFGEGCTLHIVVVRAEGRIVAIAPLLADTTRMYGIPARRLRLLHNDHTPRADFIVCARPEESYKAIWTALRARQHGWDVLQLGQVPADSPTRNRFLSLAATDGCRTGIWPSGEAPYLMLTGTWEQYFGSLSPKFRQNVRNRLGRLSKIGQPALETLAAGTALLGAREDAFRLEASDWKADAGTSICSDASVHRFYTLLAERAADRGWMRLIFLTVDGRRIATSYGAAYDNRLFLFKTGYDPEFEKCSPFKLLTYFVLRDAYEQGLHEVDFLGDTEPWKLEWTRTTRPHDWLFLFADSARGRLLHRAKFQLVPALKRWRK